MKKFLSLLLAVMMLLSCIPAMAEDALVWKINASLGTLKLDSGSKAVGHVEIPAEVDGVAVMALDYMCFKSTYDITSITIPDTVRMFECNTLDGAASLTALPLPRDLIIIKNGSLTNMPLLETLIVPPSVSVVNGAFSNLPKMKSITFEGVCPVFVEDSYYGMFVDLPEDCVIYVPDDQINAYKAAFADREDVVARIQPSGKNAVIIDWTAPESDFQFDAATGTITGYTGTASRIDIPSTIGGVAVKHIGKQAFLQKYSLMYVTIPEGVETIEKQAFHGCSLMTYVSFPTTLHTIGDSAFNTNNLVDVGWAEGLESIGNKAFYNSDICYATLPATLRTIADSGFENAGFVDVTFGPNVETVGEKGFAAKTIETITYTGTTMPTFGADAFKGCTKAATLTLADGSAQELYDSFVAYMADAFPNCVVNEPVGMAAAFPALDVMAGMPFFGDWHAVAGKDVMGDFTNDYPVVNATLNPDGTANVILDGVEMPSGWYVEAGYAFLAAAENGKPDAAATYAMANIDENGRLVIDFFYAAAICEQDGKTYAAPARPETPWPELDLSNGQYFVGTWQTADGSMTLTLNDDGTASSVEPGEEPYTLRWYADYGTAYVGETVNEAAQVTFDGSGNIVMKMGDQQIVLAPYVEELTTPVVENPADFIGTWVETDGMGTLVINADGTAVMNYSDGTVYELPWQQTATGGEFTGGMWWGSPMELQLDGSLSVDGGWMVFVREGEEYVGGTDDYDDYSGYDMPEAQPIGPEGEPYFGTWTMDMGGMAMNLTLNQDGTCTMEIFGEVEPGVWTMVDGKANVMGDELYIDGDGNLVMESQGMLFVKSEGGAASDEMSDEDLLALLVLLGQMAENDMTELPEHLQPYVGTWHMVYLASGGLTGDLRAMGITGQLVLNADGTGTMSGLSDEQGPWGDDEGVVRFGESGTKMELLKDEGGELNGFLMLGTELSGYMVFSQDETASWTPAPVTAPAPVATPVPAAPQAPAAGGDVQYVGQKMVCKTYTSFGMTMDASMLGAEYAVLFYDNGTADFTMAGFTVAALPYSVTADGVYAINYYGTMFNCVPTDTGFDMDYYGTMTMHLIPAE